jgi:HemY protein
VIRVLLYLIALGAVMVGVAWVAAQPGDVTIVWQDWRLDTSVGVLAAAVAIIAILAALLVRFWTALVTAPRRLRRWRRDRRQRAGYAALSAGLIAVAAGDPAGARREAKRADRLLGAPPLTLLLTAQAAQLSGDDDTAYRHFTAMLEQPQTEFLGLRGLLARALRDGESGRALGLAKRARALRPKTPWVLTTLLDLQSREGDWPGAAETLAQIGAAKALPAAELRRHAATVELELSRAAASTGQTSDALRHAKRAYRAEPDHPAVASWLAERYASAGRRGRAAKLVEQAWTRRPHPDLLTVYRQAKAPATPLAWVGEVQRLAGLAPKHPDSHRALGEAALDAELWGEARKHFTAAIAASGDAPPASFCRKLAAIEERDRGDAAAAQRWLTLAAEGHPDATWICEACGAAHAAWRPVCGRCRSFDRLAWRIPDRAIPTLPPPRAPAPAAVLDGPMDRSSAPP